MASQRRTEPQPGATHDWLLQHSRHLLAAGWVRAKRVLDLGGAGTGSSDLLLRSGATSVLSTEDSLHHLADAQSSRRETQGHHLLSANPHETPLVSGAFDVVLVFNGLPDPNDPSLIIREIRRLLAPGGVLILFQPSPLGEEDKSLGSTQRRRDLKEALDRVFPEVILYGQGPSDHFYFDLSKETARSSKGNVEAPTMDSLEAHQIRVAFCFSDEDFDKIISRPAPFDDTSEELERTQLLYHRLQAQFQERTEWAVAQDRELARTQTIYRDLRAEFDRQAAILNTLQSQPSECPQDD